MQYRTFKFKQLPSPYSWQLPLSNGHMQTFYNKDTIVFASGGAVADYEIDNDYLVDNNSTVKLTRETKAVAGQIIVLIDDSGVYDQGVIVSVDNENLKILYKGMISLFDASALNPARADGTNDGTTPYYYDAVNGTAQIIASLYCDSSTDRYKRLPLFFRTSGGGGQEEIREYIGTYRFYNGQAYCDEELYGKVLFVEYGSSMVPAYVESEVDLLAPANDDWYIYTDNSLIVGNCRVYEQVQKKYYVTPAIWDYKDNTFNIRSWLKDLFNSLNVVIQFRLVFEVERAYIEIYLSRNTTGGRLLKDNIHGMKIKHSEESSASATVCQVIDKNTKRLLSTWYLLTDNTISSNPYVDGRVQPYKLKVVEFDADNTDGATEKTVAEATLRYSDFNHYINVSLSKDSAMMPKNLQIGDAVTLVTELKEMNKNDEILQSTAQDGAFQSIYTGRKESSSSNEVTLLFGKIRINYTDLIQMRNAKLIRS